MHATFTVGTNPKTCLDEAAAHAALAEHRLPDTEDGLMGRVILTADGASSVEFRDDLQFLVPKLCLRALPHLAAEGQVTITMASRPQSTTLLRDGDTVRLLDEQGTDIGAFPYAPLVAALRDCAMRFTDYIGALAAQEPDWRKFHELLQRELAAAPS